MGRAASLCPVAGRLDVDLLGYGQSIINVDAQIPHRALNLRVAKKELNGPQIARAPVNQGRLVRRRECVP